MPTARAPLASAMRAARALPEAARSARGVLGAGAVVGAATVAVNGLAYVVPVLAARVLPAAELGALGALLAVGGVASVVGVGLQTALAVRWARSARLEGAGRVSVLTASVTAAVLLVGTPVLATTLTLSLAQPVLLAVLVFPVVLAGRWLGELQGRQRYGRLAIAMVLLSLARYGGILAALFAGLGVTAAFAVGAVAAYATVAVIVTLTRRAGGPSAAPAGQGAAARVGGREVLRASSATIAMLTVSYADLVIARALLSGDDSGAYTVGAVLTKGALWAPGALVVLALPMFAQARRHAVRITLVCAAACGGLLVSAAALFDGLAVRLAAGGADYGHLAPYAAGFATVGALYALVFVLVNAEIAAMTRRPALWLWLALAGLATAAALLRPSTVGGVLTLSLATAAVTTLTTAAVYALRRRRHPRP